MTRCSLSYLRFFIVAPSLRFNTMPPSVIPTRPVSIARPKPPDAGPEPGANPATIDRKTNSRSSDRGCDRRPDREGKPERILRNRSSLRLSRRPHAKRSKLRRTKCI